MIDAKLPTLLGDPLVRGCAAAVEALGVAGMKPRQHRPADVVEDRGEGDLVTVPESAELGDPVGGPLHVEGMQAEAVGGEREPAVPIEDVVRGGRAQNRLNRTGAEALDPVGDAANAPTALQLAGRADDRAGEADVGLDHARDLVRRRPAIQLLERLIAALLESRLALSLVEGRGQDASAALTSSAVLDATCGRGRRCHGSLIGTAWPIV